MVGQLTSDFYYGMKTNSDLVDISLPVLRPVEGLVRALVSAIIQNNPDRAAREALKSSPLLEDAARLMGYDFKDSRKARGSRPSGLGGSGLGGRGLGYSLGGRL